MAWSGLSDLKFDALSERVCDRKRMALLVYGYIPVIVADACGAGDHEAARRSLASLEFAGDAMLTDAETICGIFGRMRSRN